MEPVYAFDRELIPAGTVMLGKVSRTQPISKGRRFGAILNGDFTPLRHAEVEFTTLKLPDCHELAIHTVENMGLNSIFVEPSTKKTEAQKTRKPMTLLLRIQMGEFSEPRNKPRKTASRARSARRPGA